MTRSEPGPGEAAERARTRRMWLIWGALFLAGLPIGFFAALLEKGGDAGFMTGMIPAWFALLSVVVFLVATVGGALVWRSRMDELDRRDHLYTNSAAGSAIVIGYPTWFILWKGGLAPAPEAFSLFAAAMLAGLATFLYFKLKPAF